MDDIALIALSYVIVRKDAPCYNRVNGIYINNDVIIAEYDNSEEARLRFILSYAPEIYTILEIHSDKTPNNQHFVEARVLN